MSTNSTACPDCGAPLKPGYPKKQGWGENKVWTCGREVDDGPGAECPNKKKTDGFDDLLTAPTEPVDVTISVSAVVDVLEPSDEVTRQPVAVIPNELAETFPVVLVDGVLQEVKTIPELSKAARLEEVLAHVETFSKMVVTKDDKKGADLADERRKLAKRIRVAVTKICKQEREEAVEELKKIQSFWISTDNTIEARLKAVEDHLAAQVKVYNDEKERLAKEAQAEKDRIALETAAEAKRVLQAKIQRLVDLGATPNVVKIAAATDEQFEAMVAEAATAHAERLAQQDADRVERERLAEVQRVRTERIESRTGESLRAGIAPFWSTLDQLADMTDDEFRGELAEAIEAKALADQEREAARAEQEAQAAELARLRREAAKREEAERLAREAAEAARLAAEEAARIERERPDREKTIKWLDAIDHDLVIMVPVFAEQQVADIVTAGLTNVLNALHELQRNLGKA